MHWQCCASCVRDAVSLVFCWGGGVGSSLIFSSPTHKRKDKPGDAWRKCLLLCPLCSMGIRRNTVSPCCCGGHGQGREPGGAQAHGALAALLPSVWGFAEMLLVPEIREKSL